MSNKLVPSSGGLGGILRLLDSKLAYGIDTVTEDGSRVIAYLSWDLGDGNGEQRVAIVMCDGIPGCTTGALTTNDTSLANLPIGSKAMNINTGDWFTKVHATASYWRTDNVMVYASDPAATLDYLAIGSMVSYNSHCYFKSAAAGTATWVIMTD
jgi:hypothetical protein